MTDVNARNGPADWARFIARHGVGDRLDGRVTSVVSFGAFVEVAPGVEGLLHASELDPVPEVGTDLTVRVDRIDATARRMSLAPA